MQKRNQSNFSSDKLWSIILFSVYFLLSAVLFPFFRFSLRQDIISYLSISEKYIKGQFDLAINGVWGPLLSWLIIPFHYLSIDLITGYKILQIVIGAFTLLGINNLFNIFSLHAKLKLVISFAVIWIIEYYVFLTGTPDLLLACISIFLLLLFIKWKKNKSIYNFYCGILGALMYYAKPYGFPSFILLYTGFYVLTFWFNLSNDINKSIRDAVIGILIFFILAAPWIYLLSAKYGEITFSTGGEYNFAVIGPEYQGEHTFRLNTLYEPVNESAISYWEDPTFLNVKKWNPFDSVDNFFHFVNNIINNLYVLIYFSIKSSPLLLLFLLLSNPKRFSDKKLIKIIFLFVTGYVSGLLLVFVRERFLIIWQIFIVILTVLYLQEILGKFKFKHVSKSILILSISLTVAIQPVYSISNYLNDGKDIYQKSIDIKELMKLGNQRNIASITFDPLDEDWSSAITLCYFTGSKYFGEIDNDLDNESLYKQLSLFNINYLFVWGSENEISCNKLSEIYRQKICTKYSLISGSNFRELIIYQVDLIKN